MASLRASFEEIASRIRFDANGLVPAVLQDVSTGRVLMLAYMNEESLRRTFESGRCWFYSRSRQELWEKGATSGNYQLVEDVALDCDGDALLIRVRPQGPACHTGRQSCFDEEVPQSSPPVTFHAMIEDLRRLLHQRNVERPEGSYTTNLFEAGVQQIAKKLGEEGVELAIAAVGQDDRRLCEEAADLIYNLLVLLEARGVSLEAVGQELQRRAVKRLKK